MIMITMEIIVLKLKASSILSLLKYTLLSIMKNATIIPQDKLLINIFVKAQKKNGGAPFQDSAVYCQCNWSSLFFK